VLNVFLTRPDNLYGSVDVLRDAHGLLGAVHFEPAPEAPTEQVVMNNDFLEWQSADLCGNRLGARIDLRSHPDLAAIGAHMNRTVHRFHPRVREKWHPVLSVHSLALTQAFIGIANRLGNCALGSTRRLGLFPNLRLVHRRVRAFVP
jgi:hypothetical protein